MSVTSTTTQVCLRVIRAPLDLAIGLLPSSGNGTPPARIAVDRVDAAIRGIIGQILRDPTLIQDADRRRAAAEERERAQDLRTHAERQAEQAESRLERRQEQADAAREQADQRAKSRRQAASRKRAAKVDAAAEVERKRRAANRRAAAKRKEELDRGEPKARLASLEAKSDALDEKAKALLAADEARRLGRAASNAKARRKNSAK
jgi:hypothetical protein